MKTYRTKLEKRGAQIVSVYVPLDLMGELRQAAQDEERSVTAHILYLVKRDLEARRATTGEPGIRRVV